jgi:hypothetical protein
MRLADLIVWGRRAPEKADDVGAARLHPHEGAADVECLSYTHDRDFRETYAAHGVPLPAAAVEHHAKVARQDELLELAGQATDAHIAALPTHHQPIVRMLRQAAREREG